MFEHGPATVAVVAAVSIAPGILRWWWGRRLARLVDDPLLPERLMQTEQRGTLVFILAIAAMTTVSPPALCWGLPLLYLAQMIGVYPLRKVLFEETWSLPAYLWFFTRLLLGAFGFWIVLMLMPILALAVRGAEPLVALGIAVVLLAWNRWAGEILRVALRAEPIVDPSLLARFTALAAKSTVHRVQFEFEQVRLHGGAIANAAALPSVQRPAVLFSETLLARLRAEEATAICAHEIAHLEYFEPRRLRQMNAVNVGLIVVGGAVAPVTRLAGVSFATLPIVVWLVFFAAVLILRARHRQRNETASDLRAVELTGDPEALVRALTKLYTFARVPRRFDTNQERHATHPSLARRIRDIRNAAGAAVASVERTSVTGADGRTVVAFTHDQLHWSEGAAASHTLSYAHLAELRLHASYSGTTQLVAVEKSGRRWSMPVAAGDVARVQDALDAVDGHLPDPVAQAVMPDVSRALVALAGVLGLVAGQVAMLFIALIAALQPASPLLAAAGAGALTAAALMVRDSPFDADTTTMAALMLALFGALLLAAAIGKRREEAPRRAMVLVSALAVFTTAAVLLVAFNGFDPIRLHQSARTVTSATVLLLALAGALACCRVRSLQYTSIGVALAGVGSAAAGSPAFLDRFATDPFIGPSEAIAWRTLSQAPVAEFTIPFYVASLRVSDGGTLVAIEPMTHGGVVEIRPFQVGRAGRMLSPLAGSDLVFPDEDHALVMDALENRVALRLISLEREPVELWRTTVTDVSDATLSFRGGRWRVLGRDSTGRFVRAEGRPGLDDVELTRWPAPETDGWIETVATSGASALAVESRAEPWFLQGTPYAPWAMLFGASAMQSHVWTIRESAQPAAAFSRLAVDCTQRALGSLDERLVCAAFDGSRTRFVAIDPADGRVTPLAWVRGRFLQHGPSGTGWLSGWGEDSLVALRLASRDAIRFSRQDVVTHVSGTDRTLATAAYRSGRDSIIRIYATADLN